MMSQQEHDEQDPAKGDHEGSAPKPDAPKQDSHAATDAAKDEHATGDTHEKAAGDEHAVDSHTTGDAHAHDAHAGTYLSTDTFAEKFQKGQDYYLDPAHLFGHVQDSDHFEVPKFLGEKWFLPKLTEKPLVSVAGTPVISGQFTKFMALEVIAAVFIFVTFKWLANRISAGGKPVGKLWNFLESIVVFVRDDIAKPALGSHDTKRFLPFLLTMFMFIIVLNLLGMIPWLGSATGSIAVTAVLAVVTFIVVIGSGMKKMGVVGFLKAQLPHMDLPPAMAIVLKPGIWAIEIFGLFVKHFVLSVRLFANMFAGHLVLAVFMALIGAVSGTFLVWLVAPVTILALIPLSLLELFVACLQAYVFVFLAALFIGAAQHAH